MTTEQEFNQIMDALSDAFHDLVELIDLDPTLLNRVEDVRRDCNRMLDHVVEYFNER